MGVNPFEIRAGVEPLGAGNLLESTGCRAGYGRSAALAMMSPDWVSGVIGRAWYVLVPGFAGCCHNLRQVLPMIAQHAHGLPLSVCQIFAGFELATPVDAIG